MPGCAARAFRSNDAPAFQGILCCPDEKARFHPLEPIEVLAANDGKGAKPEADDALRELPLSADSGRSRDRDRTAGFDPELTSMTASVCSRVGWEADIHTALPRASGK
jgi:hypothetical protein